MEHRHGVDADGDGTMNDTEPETVTEILEKIRHTRVDDPTDLEKVTELGIRHAKQILEAQETAS